MKLSHHSCLVYFFQISSLFCPSFYFNLTFFSFFLNPPFLITLPSLMLSVVFCFFVFHLFVFLLLPFDSLFLPASLFLFFSLFHSFWLLIIMWLFFFFHGTEVPVIKVNVAFVTLLYCSLDGCFPF